MSLKWKCVNSFLVLKHETPYREEAGGSGTEEQFQKPIIEEQPVTELTECDTKNGISVEKLSGYTVSYETYNTMPSAQLLPPDAQQRKRYIKEEPLEESLEYSSVSHENVAGKCEIIDKIDSCVSAFDKQMPNRCISCDIYFDSHSDLRKHMVDSHADVKNLTCLLCGESLTCNSALDVHMSVHNYDNPNRCTKCDRYFKCSSSVKLHMTVHTGEKPVCTHCGKSFRTLALVKQHMKIHRSEKPHHCTNCGKSFHRLVDLKLHMMTHTGEKPHSCTTCDKSFRTVPCLKRHLLVHTGEKPYSCTVCDKSFKTSSLLKRHMSVHTGEKPHSCTERDK